CWKKFASTSFAASALFGCTLSPNTTISRSMPCSSNLGSTSSKISVIGEIKDATFNVVSSFSTSLFVSVSSFCPQPTKASTAATLNIHLFFTIILLSFVQPSCCSRTNHLNKLHQNNHNENHVKH